MRRESERDERPLQPSVRGASLLCVQAPLFAYAASVEGAALAAAHPGYRFVEVGVGPVRATLELTRALQSGPPPDLVCVFGVAGAYTAHDSASGSAPLAVLDLVLVGSDSLCDEGVETDAGFVSTHSLGLVADGQLTAAVEPTRRLADALRAPIVVGATVSTCSGTDARADDVWARTHASVESMEGAALALVCARFGVPWVQVRVVSNRCGDRARGGWDLAGAVARLHAAMPTVLATLSGKA